MNWLTDNGPNDKEIVRMIILVAQDDRSWFMAQGLWLALVSHRCPSGPGLETIGEVGMGLADALQP